VRYSYLPLPRRKGVEERFHFLPYLASSYVLIRFGGKAVAEISLVFFKDPDTLQMVP
jgi:hypothetical protein